MDEEVVVGRWSALLSKRIMFGKIKNGVKKGRGSSLSTLSLYFLYVNMFFKNHLFSWRLSLSKYIRKR